MLFLQTLRDECILLKEIKLSYKLQKLLIENSLYFSHKPKSQYEFFYFFTPFT